VTAGAEATVIVTACLQAEIGRMLRQRSAIRLLFPKLAKRRTWLMTKKDLERAGIPYQTEEGIADFHAVGRHTHITELLRTGASLVEARELTGHSDIRMPMRYTHIGIEQQ
jgi:site-specific recombinase XerD